MEALARGFAGELRLLTGHRRYRILLALLVGATLLTVQTYHQQVLRDLPVAVVDLDNSHLSRTVRLWIDATPELSTAAATPTSIEDARQALVAGRVAGVIVVPSRFSSRVKSGEGGEVVVAADLSNMLVGRTVMRVTAKVLGTLGVGVTMTTLQKLGEPRTEARGHAQAIALAEGFPFNPEARYSVYLVPGYVYFFLHIFTLFIAFSVFLPPQGWPAPLGRERLGALAAVLVFTAVLGMAGTYLVLPHENIVPASSPVVIGASLVVFLALDLLLASALTEAVPNPLVAAQITVVVAMLSFMASGLTWPADAFPTLLRLLASAIPYTAFGLAFRAFLHAPATLGELAPAWLAMLGQAALWTTVLAVARLVRRFGKPAWSCA